jgi:hypothetical protein
LEWCANFACAGKKIEFFILKLAQIVPSAGGSTPRRRIFFVSSGAAELNFVGQFFDDKL